MGVHLTADALRGQSALVYGLGRFGGGVGAVRFLVAAGATVSIADDATEEQLADSIAALADVSIAGWALEGEHVDISNFGIVVANPGLKPEHSLFAQANAAGVPVTSEIELFLANNSAKAVGVTGTNGKSTTSAMIAHVLKHSGYQCHLGGNIGGSLLSRLGQIEPDHVVVLELSSFQLSRLRNGVFSPRVAVVTNFAPNHLDWHGSMGDYRSSKQRLLSFAGADSTVILPADDDSIATWPTKGRRLFFGKDSGENGTFVSDGTVVFRADRSEEGIPLWQMRLHGSHNLRNSLAAATACFELGVEPVAIAAGFQSYSGLPFRLQSSGQFGGRIFINDSASTTPESTIEALAAFGQPAVLIAGGADKGVDLQPLAQAAVAATKSAHWIGETRDALHRHAVNASSDFRQSKHESLADAFAAAVDVSKQGDIVILSPGCASFGMYANFADRGRHFDLLVQRLSRSES